MNLKATEPRPHGACLCQRRSSVTYRWHPRRAVWWWCALRSQLRDLSTQRSSSQRFASEAGFAVMFMCAQRFPDGAPIARSFCKLLCDRAQACVCVWLAAFLLVSFFKRTCTVTAATIVNRRTKTTMVARSLNEVRHGAGLQSGRLTRACSAQGRPDQPHPTAPSGSFIRERVTIRKNIKTLPNAHKGGPPARLRGFLWEVLLFLISRRLS